MRNQIGFKSFVNFEQKYKNHYNSFTFYYSFTGILIIFTKIVNVLFLINNN